MIDGDLFRRTMRQWAAGVTVITVGRPGKVHGMTASSFTSVSCTPPLMLFCVGLSNDTHGLVKIGETVGINLLSETQIDISGRFAKKTEARYKFDDLLPFTGPKGATLFSGCAAVMEAVVAEAYEAGDHSIFIGKIVSAETDDSKKPLVYSQGAYARLDPIMLKAVTKTTTGIPAGKTNTRKKSSAKSTEAGVGKKPTGNTEAPKMSGIEASFEVSPMTKASSTEVGSRRAAASASLRKTLLKRRETQPSQRGHGARS